LRIRSWLGLALVAICAVLIAAWYQKPGPGSTHETPEGVKVIRCDVTAQIGSLNPLEGLPSGSSSILPLIYSRLVEVNDEGKLEPDLAVKWSYDKINRVWFIEIRNDALFHDSRPVTSQDVEYSILELAKKIGPSLTSLIGGIRVLSRHSLEVFLNYDDPEFLSNLVSTLVVPSSSRDSDHSFTHPIGSGPFRYEYRHGNAEVGLVANTSYYRGRPSADRFIFYYQPVGEKSWARLLSGETDAAWSLQPKDLEILKSYEDRLTIIPRVAPYYFLLLYNISDPLFTDPIVRLAMSYALDKEFMIRRFQNGLGEIALGPIAIDSPFHNPAVSAIPYNPQKAMELLWKAGWIYRPNDRSLWKDGKRFEFTLLLFEGFQHHRKIAEYVSLCLNAIGMRVHLEVLPLSELLMRYNYNNQYQAVLTLFKGVFRNPRILARIWNPYFTSVASADSLKSSNIMDLFDRAASEDNSARQEKLAHEIEGFFNSLQPATFLFQQVEVNVFSNRINPVYDSYLYYIRSFLFRHYLFSY
jgi:peptide/nickel transport system substrate-binding protein